MFKWGLVIAGLADINRPIDKVSLFQSCGKLAQLIGTFLIYLSFIILLASCSALASTGIIWARYSTQIIPVNYNLMAVNLFVGASGIYQLARLGIHHYGQKK